MAPGDSFRWRVTVIKTGRFMDLCVAYVVDWVGAVRRLEKLVRPTEPPPAAAAPSAESAPLHVKIKRQTSRIVNMKQQLSSGRQVCCGVGKCGYTAQSVRRETHSLHSNKSPTTFTRRPCRESPLAARACAPTAANQAGRLGRARRERRTPKAGAGAERPRGRLQGWGGAARAGAGRVSQRLCAGAAAVCHHGGAASTGDPIFARRYPGPDHTTQCDAAR